MYYLSNVRKTIFLFNNTVWVQVRCLCYHFQLSKYHLCAEITNGAWFKQRKLNNRSLVVCFSSPSFNFHYYWKCIETERYTWHLHLFSKDWDLACMCVCFLVFQEAAISELFLHMVWSRSPYNFHSLLRSSCKISPALLHIFIRDVMPLLTVKFLCRKS